MSQRYTGGVSSAAGIASPSNTNHTLCGWVYVAGAAGSGDVVYLDTTGGGGGGGVGEGFTWLGFDATANILTFQEVVSGAPAWSISAPLTLNTWTHIALVYDLSGSTASAYVNGALVSGPTAIVIGIRNAYNHLDIGYGGDFTVQNCFYFDQVLGAAQIYDCMNLRVPSGYTATAWYKLDNAAPTLDSSGNSHTLSAGGDANGTQLIIASTASNTVSSADSPAGLFVAPAASASQRFVGTTTANAIINFPLSAPHTVCFWRWVDNYPDSGAVAYLLGLYGGTSHLIEFGLGGPSPIIGFRDYSTATSSGLNTTFATSAGTWRHYAIVYDGTNVSAYFQAGISTTVTPVNFAGSGSANTLSLRPTNGYDFTLQAVMLFTQALTASQLQECMNLVPPAGVTPYAWYKLDSSNPTLDSSGNGHTLDHAGTYNGTNYIIASSASNSITSADASGYVQLTSVSSNTITDASGVVSGGTVPAVTSRPGRNSQPSRRMATAFTGRRSVRN